MLNVGTGPRQIRWIRTVVGVLTVAAVAIVLILVGIGFRKKGIDPGAASQGLASDSLRFKGLKHRFLGEGGEVFSFEASEVHHKKTKLGPLTLNPVKEIWMSDVRIRIDVGSPLPEGGSSNPVPLSASKVIQYVLKNHDLGFVRRVVIHRFESFFVRGDESLWELRAGKATLGLGAPRVLFENGFSLVSSQGHQLTAMEAEWRPDVRCIQVRGPFSAQVDEGRRRGKGGAFSLGRDGELILQQSPCPRSR
jgi:hypothetical protein